MQRVFEPNCVVILPHRETKIIVLFETVVTTFIASMTLDSTKDLHVFVRFKNIIQFSRVLIAVMIRGLLLSLDFQDSFIWSSRAHCVRPYLEHVVLLQVLHSYLWAIRYFSPLLARIVSGSLSPISFTNVLQIFISLSLFIKYNLTAWAVIFLLCIVFVYLSQSQKSTKTDTTKKRTQKTCLPQKRRPHWGPDKLAHHVKFLELAT